MTCAVPDVGLAAPEISTAVVSALRVIGWPYLRFALGFERVSIRGARHLVAAFDEALSGRASVVLAFRHPFGDEAQLLSWVFSAGVEREARSLGVRLPVRPWAVFVHGYEVPRWSGPLVRWLLPRTGSMPVHHSKLDRSGLERILAAMENGPWPVAIAPEGQVSYASQTVPRLEEGAVRLGFQVAGRIDRRERQQTGQMTSPEASGQRRRVVIVPVSVHRRYDHRAEASLDTLLRRTEAFAGLPVGQSGTEAQDTANRMGALQQHLLSFAEKVYALPACSTPDTAARVGHLVQAALKTAERLLGMTESHDDDIERLYRIRQVGWDRIYMKPGFDLASRPPVERAVLDRKAGEAWYAMRHMELADFIWYFRSDPPGNEAPMHDIIEYAQNLWDLANRLAGGTIRDRREVHPKQAVVACGEPIDLGAMLPHYQQDRSGARSDAMSALESAFLSLAKETMNDA